MRPLNRPLLFLLFFISGFCGLLYQVICPARPRLFASCECLPG
jgi:hypothetical protein